MRFGLCIEARAWKLLDRCCRRAGDAETGGVLVGFYAPALDVACVTEASGPPADSERGRTWFRRGVAGLESLFRRHWSAARRRHYIGEWHYHPAADIEPSPDDLEQMASISRSPKFQCSEPIMVIVGASVPGGSRRFRAFVFPRDTPYEEFTVDAAARVAEADSPGP